VARGRRGGGLQGGDLRFWGGRAAARPTCPAGGPACRLLIEIIRCLIGKFSAPCTGSGPGFYSGTEFASLANQYGFIVIYPSVTRSGSCWDVSSSQALTRNGGSFFTGTVDGWNSQCADGQVSMTPQAWGDLVRNTADPGYSGPRPRMQLWHGTADTTLNYNNLGEEIKQWTNVLGVSQTPSSTDTPVSGWTRTRYDNGAGTAEVEAYSIAGAGHVLPETGMAAYAIHFLGLDSTSTPRRPARHPRARHRPAHRPPARRQAVPAT
jgi:hypothetical protein